MAEFLRTVYRQMRMVTAFEIVNHALSMGLIGSTAGVTLWLWTQGRSGWAPLRGDRHGSAAQRNFTLGHVGNGVLIRTNRHGAGRITTLARSPTVLDRPGAQPLRVTRGDIRFEGVSFAYGAVSNPAGPVIDNLNLHIRPGEKIGLVGRSGAGKSTIVNLLLRFYDIPQGRVLIDGQDISLRNAG